MSASNTPNKDEFSNDNDDNTNDNSSTAMMNFMLFVGPALCCAYTYYFTEDNGALREVLFCRCV